MRDSPSSPELDYQAWWEELGGATASPPRSLDTTAWRGSSEPRLWNRKSSHLVMPHLHFLDSWWSKYGLMPVWFYERTKVKLYSLTGGGLGLCIKDYFFLLKKSCNLLKKNLEKYYATLKINTRKIAQPLSQKKGPQIFCLVFWHNAIIRTRRESWCLLYAGFYYIICSLKHDKLYSIPVKIKNLVSIITVYNNIKLLLIVTNKKGLCRNEWMV